jgi:hypothetical protein
MYRTSRICCLLLAFCSAIEASSSELNWHALWQGEVHVEALEHEAGFPGLRASFVVPAARERIWAVLLDYQHFPEIFPGIDKIHVLEHDAQGAKVAYWVDAMLQKYHYVLYRHYEKPGWRLTWRRLSGDLQRIEGSWEVRETPRRGMHLLVYESYVQVRGMVPTSLVRWGAMQKAREMGRRLRQWITHGSIDPVVPRQQEP